MKRSHGLALIYAMIAIMLFISWRCWCEPLVDFGREMYVPWQLARGKTLYRDIAYFNGPISPYFNAMIFRVFGEGILTLAIVNALLLALTLTFLHAILTKLTDLALATITCVCLAPLMCIAQPGQIANYNFITPYSHEMTHGLLLSLAAIACLMRVHPRWDLVAGLCAGLTILTKPEIGIACCSSIIVGASLIRRPSAVLRIVIVMIIPPLVALILFRSSAFTAYLHLLDSRVTQLPFYRLTMGTFDLSASLISLGIWSAAWLLVLLIGETIAAQLDLPKRIMLLVIMIVGALFALDLVNWRNVAMPLILSTGWALWHLYRDREPNRFVFCLFAFLLLGKIALNVTLSNYGFVLALPALGATVSFLGSWKQGFRLRAMPSLRWTTIAMLCVVAAVYLALSVRQWNVKKLAMGAGIDRFLISADRSVAKAMLDSVELPKDASLAVVPQGAMLNYLARRENSTPYIVLMPPEVIMFGEDRIIAAYEAHPPEYVLFVQTDVSEYGYSGFDQYAPKMTAFLRANYDRLTYVEGHYSLLRLK